jgi:hypothetical protein
MSTNSHTIRNSILSGIAMAALLVYVLACTSFSPDDRRVLFPAFDAQHGGVAAMVYDRKTRQIEQVFASVNPVVPGKTNRTISLLRPQWFPDGKHILVARQDQNSDVELTVIPYGTHDPVRSLQLPKSDFEDSGLVMPMPILGSEIFIPCKDKSFAAFNLVTGAARISSDTNKFALYADASGKTLFGWTQSHDGNDSGTFGKIDPATLVFQPLTEIPAQQMSDGGTIAFTPERVCMLGTWDHTNVELRVFHAGKLEFSRTVETGGRKVKFGPDSALSPKGNCLYASFASTDQHGTNYEYGVAEVPFTKAPVRWTTLLRTTKGDEADILFFQGGLSHDGSTWAVSSAFLWAQNEHLQNSDSALFLVDLNGTQRKVTKVSIPVPPEFGRPRKF